MRTKQLLTKMLLLVAVMLMGAGTAWAADPITFELSGTNGKAVTSVNSGDVTITFSKGTNTNNGPTWYDNGSALRFYSGNTITFASSGAKIEKVVLTNTESQLVGGSNGANFPSNGTYSVNDKVETWTASTPLESFTVSITNKPRLTKIEVYLEEDNSKVDCDLTLTGAPVTLSFDLYNNVNAQTINFTTSSTGAVTVSESEYVSCVVNGNTITVTPLKVTPSAQTITVSQAADDTYKAGSVSFTVTVDDSTPVPTHTVTFSVNGTSSTQDFEEGAAILFPTDITDVEGKSFVGWTETAITGVTDEAPTFITSATMGTEALTFYAVFADKTAGTQTTVTDVLTSATTGVSGTNSYSNWSGKTVTSDAVYAGNSAVAGSTGAIQMRSNNNNSGIISTTSGGTLKSVTVSWTDGNTSGRSLDVYGSNTAYEAATDLYNSSKQGTKLGSIVYGTSTSLTVSGDYAYIGLRSNNGAMYFTNISIEWTTGTPDTYSAYCTTVVAAAVAKPVITVAENPFFFSTTATITCATEGATIKYSFDGETWNDYSEALTITETTTVYAKAIKGNDESTVAQVTATKNLATPTVSIDATGITNTNVYDGTAAGSLAATVTYNDAAISGATVVWSGDNDDVATIDENGVVTLVAAGSVTFTATYAGSTDYNEATATYTMTVTNTDPNAPGTENNPYTVAQAIAAIDAGAGVTGVYATGIVSKIVTAYSSQYGNISYNISADGSTDGDQLQAFRGKSYNGDSFTSEDDIQVGDVVVIYGDLTKYNTTYEFAQNNQLVSLERPADTTPRITIADATVSVDAGEHDGTLDLTYENLTITSLDDFGVQFYDAEGNELMDENAPSWIVALVAEQDPQVGEGYVVSYVVEANEGDARTAYLKVFAMGDEEFVYSNTVTITQAKYVAPDVTVDPAVAGVGAFVKVTSTEDITAGNYLIVYEGNGTHDAVAFNGALETLDAANNGISVAIVDGKIPATAATVAATFTLQPSGSLKSTSGLYIGVSGNSNGLKTSKDATTYTNSFSIDESGNAVISAAFDGSTMSLRYNYASDNLRFRYYKNSGQQAIQLYKYDATAPAFDAITVTTAGYATYCSENNLDFSNVEGLTAYKATVTDKQVSFDEVGQVPAGDGVLLKGAAGTYAIPVIDSAAEIENALVGVTEATEKEAGIFVLMNPEGGKGVGFYKTTQTFTVGANTAYLPAIEGTRSFIALDEATAIEDVAAEKMLNGEVYNLQGQRVESSIFNVQSSMLKKGLYIMDGKKVLVK